MLNLSLAKAPRQDRFASTHPPVQALAQPKYWDAIVRRRLTGASHKKPPLGTKRRNKDVGVKNYFVPSAKASGSQTGNLPPRAQLTEVTVKNRNRLPHSLSRDLQSGLSGMIWSSCGNHEEGAYYKEVRSPTDGVSSTENSRPHGNRPPSPTGPRSL